MTDELQDGDAGSTRSSWSELGLVDDDDWSDVSSVLADGGRAAAAGAR